jgi:hypothetical protein
MYGAPDLSLAPVEIKLLVVVVVVLEFVQEMSPLLPNPCHSQKYDQSMSQLSHGSKECKEGGCGGIGELGNLSLFSRGCYCLCGRPF